MKLVPIRETPLLGRVQSFGQSRLSAPIAFLVLAGGAAAMGAAIVRGALPWGLWFMVGFLGLISLLFLGAARAAFSPDNWVLKFDGAQIALKFRSYLNRHFPAEDAVVAVFPASAVESVGKVVEKRTVPGAGAKESPTQETAVYLQFRMKDPAATAELGEAIRLELGREAPKIGMSRTKHIHAPVQVTEPGTIRIAWRSPRDFVRPSIATALRQLGGSMRVDTETAAEAKDWRSMSPEALEAYIVELARTGEKLSAVKLVRESRGLGLREAKELVEALLK